MGTGTENADNCFTRIGDWHFAAWQGRRGHRNEGVFKGGILITGCGITVGQRAEWKTWLEWVDNEKVVGIGASQEGRDCTRGVTVSYLEVWELI